MLFVEYRDVGIRNKLEFVSLKNEYIKLWSVWKNVQRYLF